MKPEKQGKKALVAVIRKGEDKGFKGNQLPQGLIVIET